jgi:TRAP-type C4-dicarboxylate transport system substrate-binding protein
MNHHIANFWKGLGAVAGGVALAVVVSASTVPTIAVSQEFVLIAATQVPVDTPFDKGINKLKELVEARSNGRIVINTFPNAQLGNEPELFQGMTEGTIDIAVVAPGQIAEWVPEIALLEMPFVITNIGQRDRVVGGAPVARLSAIMRERTDVEIIGVFGGGVRNMFFREPASSLDDIQGRRFRVQPSPQLTDAYSALGLEPTVTSYRELFNALQQGVAEGAEMEAIYVEAAGFPQAAPHFLMTGHVITVRPLCMSGKTLDKLPEDLRKIVLDAAMEAAAYERSVEATDDRASLDRMAQMEGVTFTDIDVAPMIAAVRPIWEKYAEEWGLVDLLEEIDTMR